MLTNGFVVCIYMNDINQLFFELIRVAIGNAVCLSQTPTTAEWNALYAMAKEQSLVGICFAGVQRLQDAVHRWLALRFSASRRISGAAW